jgi:peroxidase
MIAAATCRGYLFTEQTMRHQSIFPALVSGCLVTAAMLSQPLAQSDSPIALLVEFRPIGGGGNNLNNPGSDAMPGSAELALAPLAFAKGADDGLVGGPNARAISNVIAGGSASNGVDAETSIALTRDARSPISNTIINAVAGYLDLSQLYGSTVASALSQRNSDGTLKSSANGQHLPVVNDAFIAGDARVMQNPELSAVTIRFMREHNYWVAALRAQHPDCAGDQLYQMAKAITTAQYQNIVYTEYLPILIGLAAGSYQGYDPRVTAQVTQEFSTAVFRVAHSQDSDTQEGLDHNGQLTFTEVLRNLLFAPLIGGDIDRMVLIAIDIQRERDVGLGYDVDVFIGGPAEDHARGSLVGPAFQAIIARQFRALRSADRFYWQ